MEPRHRAGTKRLASSGLGPTSTRKVKIKPEISTGHLLPISNKPQVIDPFDS